MQCCGAGFCHTPGMMARFYTNIHIMTGLKKLVILTCVVIKLACNLQLEWSELNCAINITTHKKCHIFSHNSAWNGPTIKTICTTLVTNYSHRKKIFLCPQSLQKLMLLLVLRLEELCNLTAAFQQSSTAMLGSLPQYPSRNITQTLPRWHAANLGAFWCRWYRA